MSSVATDAPRGGFGALVPRLQRAVWVVQAGMLVNNLGTGLVLPFLIVYLHDTRGFSLATAGLVAAAFGAASLVATPLSGPLIDRYGDRAVLIGAPLVLAAGYGLLAAARTPWQAALCLVLAGLGNGAFWPAQSVLMVRLVPPASRHTAFSVNRMTGNLGIGLGVLAGGLIVGSGGSGRFEVLFVANAVSFVLLALAAFAVPAGCAVTRAARKGSYGSVLRHRTFMAVVGLNAIFVAVGFAQLEAALPAFARHQAGATPLAIGLIFIANIAAVVLFQLPVSRAVEGRRRMRVLAATAGVWVAAMMLVELAGAVAPALLAITTLVLAGAVFGLGECLHGTVASPLAADLAPEESRGRYMALSTSSFAIGFTVGPAAAGFVLGLAPFALWPLAAAVAVGAGAGALWLERRLPEAVRLTPSSS